MVAKKGLRKCFISGGTSSCRTHIRTHYSEYTERCKKAGISEHHWALPRKLVKEREQLQKREEGTIEAMGFKPKPGHTTLEPFSKESVLKYVAKFVVCTDQVSRLNCPAVITTHNCVSPALCDCRQPLLSQCTGSHAS